MSLSQRSGTAREVLDYVSFYELWDRLRQQHATDQSFFVTMLGYRWGREQSALRHAVRGRWFHKRKEG